MRLKRLDVLRAGYYSTVPVLLASIRLTTAAERTGRRGLAWAARVSPNMESLMYDTMAEVQTLAGDPEKAIAMLQERHRRRPMGDLNYRIGRIHDRCGNQVQASAYFKRALVEDSPEEIQAVRDIIETKLRHVD